MRTQALRTQSLRSYTQALLAHASICVHMRTHVRMHEYACVSKRYIRIEAVLATSFIKKKRLKKAQARKIELARRKRQTTTHPPPTMTVDSKT